MKRLDELTDEESVMDLYSLKNELSYLNKNSKVFDYVKNESSAISREVLEQIQDLSMLIKLRSLANEISNKAQINDKLDSLHFSLNIMKNGIVTNDFSKIKNAINSFLHDDSTKISSLINELNDFKAKIGQIETYNSCLFSKNLDTKLNIEHKYSQHIEKLYSIHKKQKEIFLSITSLFLKLMKSHIKNNKGLNTKSLKNKRKSKRQGT